MAEHPDQAPSPDPAAVPGAGAPSRPRRRLRRVLWLLLAVAGVLVIVVALLPTFLSLSIGKDRMLAIASRSLKVPVEAGELSLSWLGEQSLTGLRIGSPQGFSASEDVVRVERIAIKKGLLGLAFSGGAAVEIEKPVIHIRRNAEGAFNFEALGGRRSRRAEDGGAPDPGQRPREGEPRPAPGEPPVSSRFSLAVEDGLVTYHDEALGTAAEVRAIALEASLGPEGAAIEATAEIRHPGAEAAPPGRLIAHATLTGWDESGSPLAGDADIRAEGIDLEPWKALLEKLGGLAPAGGPLGFEASAKVADGKGAGRLEMSGGLRCRGWTVSGAGADFRTEGGKIALEKGSASVNGGRAILEKLSVDLDADPPRFGGAVRLEGAAANYELAPLLAYVVPFLSLGDRQADFRGTIEGTLSLEAAGLDRPSIERSLRGQGMLRVRDGTIDASQFFQDAAKLIGADLEKVLFSEMGSDFEIADAKVRCDRVFLTGKPGSKIRNLGLKGETTFDGRLDFGVDLAAIEETVGSKRIRRILETTRKALGDSVFPLKLKGTLRSPELAIEAPQGFPGLDAVLDEEKGLEVKDILDAFRSRRKKRDDK